MKPIACSRPRSAPDEASPVVPRARSFSARRGARLAARQRALGVGWFAALAGLGCTVTSDDYAPAPLGEESDRSGSGRELGAAGGERSGIPTPLSGLSPIGDASQEVAADLPLASSGETSHDGAGAPSASDPVPAEALPAGDVADGGVEATPGIEAEPGNPGNEAEPGSEPAQPGELPPDVSALVGWASVPGLGVATTTGGGAGAPAVARTAAELVELAARPEPLIIAIEGTLAAPALELGSNKTLVGVGPDATLLGGIAIRGTADAFVENVIVSNLNVVAATSSVDGDAIQVHYAHHVWIDHCALSDAPDGLLDIVHASDFVTVSYTRFFYTEAAPDPEHRFAALIGHDVNNGAEDLDRLNVTWHHDLWGEGVARALSGRFGSIHVYSSLFRSPEGEAGLTAGLASSWLVEDNQFEDVSAPHAILAGSGASLAATGNVYLRSTGARDFTPTGFVPAYPYRVEPPSALRATLDAEVGPR